MLLIPLLYYGYGPYLTDWIVSEHAVLLILFIMMMVLECIRLKYGWIIFGQRQLEKRAISSLAYGFVGICVVLWLAPGPGYAVPIIAASAVADPLLGELRATRLPKYWIASIAVLVVWLIWSLSSHWFPTSPLLWCLMAPLTVLLEWPNIRWVDDNFLMLLAPLLVVLVLY